MIEFFNFIDMLAESIMKLSLSLGLLIVIIFVLRMLHIALKGSENE